MKFFSKNKVSLVALFIILVAAGGFYLYKVKSASSVNNGTTEYQAQEQEATEPRTGEGDIKDKGTSTPAQIADSQSTTSSLADVSLTATLIKEEISVGGQKMPAGVITLYFYPPAGTFNIEKKTLFTWSAVVKGQSYPGHGGFAAPYLNPNEDNATYRVVALDKTGKAVASSKSFTVKRSDLQSGSKTYD